MAGQERSLVGNAPRFEDPVTAGPFRVGPAAFQVTTENGPLAEALGYRFADLVDPSVQVARGYSLEHAGPHWLTNPWVIWRGAEVARQGINPRFVLPALLRLAADDEAAAIGHGCQLKGTAVELFGRRVLLVAPAVGETVPPWWDTRAITVRLLAGGARLVSHPVCFVEASATSAVARRWWGPLQSPLGPEDDSLLNVAPRGDSEIPAPEDSVVPASRFGGLAEGGDVDGVAILDVDAAAGGGGGSGHHLAPLDALPRLVDAAVTAQHRLRGDFRQLASIAAIAPALRVSVDLANLQGAVDLIGSWVRTL